MSRTNYGRSDSKSNSADGKFVAKPDFDSPRTDSAIQKEGSISEQGSKARNAKSSQEKKPRKATDLQIRLRTGVVYAIVIIVGAMLGNIATMILFTLVAGITAGEFFFMLRNDAKLPNEVLGIIGAAAYPPFAYFFGLAGMLCVSIAQMIFLIIWYVCWTRARIADVCVSFFGAAYTGMLLSSIVLMRMSVQAPEPWPGIFVLFIFTVISLNDGFAYLVGRKLGKHKMVPRVSPKKSWEGFFGGLIVSTAFWCILIIFPGVNVSLPQAIIFGLLTGIAGVFGDLVESRMKRNSGVKDSGTIMPGHGGLLDRMDSVFVVCITSAILLFSFGCLPFDIVLKGALGLGA